MGKSKSKLHILRLGPLFIRYKSHQEMKTQSGQLGLYDTLSRRAKLQTESRRPEDKLVVNRTWMEGNSLCPVDSIDPTALHICQK